ncbi:conjugal transfer protein TrbL family protein [Sporosarcina sp.]|uniref:conjugal transfer protein TrbL family protein n=1 Tax=Sporosarcina sp. TaxID=49982 RepID=UPI00260F63E4|nr:conjugal transfer protein TrbL family protein [Sporosarcina sp.]
MFSVKDKVMEMIDDWLNDMLTAVFKFLAEVLFNHEALSGLFLDVYSVFAVFGGVLLVAIVLFRILNAMLNEATNHEGNISEIIMSSLKASAMVFLLPVILYFVVKEILYPLMEYMFVEIAGSSSDIITDSIASTMDVDIFGTGTMAATLLLLFLIVVFVIFTFKICVYHVDLIILEVFSVFAAITIATENYDFSEVWWREFLSQIVSIVTQVLLMAALVQLLANFNSWYDFMLIIGCGVLIIRGPSVLRSMWYSSGGAKGGISLGKSATRVSMMRLLK